MGQGFQVVYALMREETVIVGRHYTDELDGHLAPAKGASSGKCNKYGTKRHCA